MKSKTLVMKVVTWSLIFMLVLISLTVTTTILVFFGWWNPFREITSKWACEMKIQRYCQMVVCERQPDVDLTGCVEGGTIPTREWCERKGFSCKSG